MFAAVADRVARMAARRAQAKRQELAARLAAELPRGIAVAVTEVGVRLSGRGLRRRLAGDPSLAGLIAGAVK